MKKEIFKIPVMTIVAIILVFGLSIAVQSIFAWTAPTANPPEGNINPPIFNESGDPDIAYTSLPFGAGGDIVSGGDISYSGELRDGNTIQKDSDGNVIIQLGN